MNSFFSRLLPWKAVLLTSDASGTDRTDYGMPSAHAQFSFFFAVYFSILLWKRYTFSPSCPARPGSSRWFLHQPTAADTVLCIPSGNHFGGLSPFLTPGL
jgi:membrane-associated phospholipid phosphatase